MRKGLKDPRNIKGPLGPRTLWRSGFVTFWNERRGPAKSRPRRGRCQEDQQQRQQNGEQKRQSLCPFKEFIIYSKWQIWCLKMSLKNSFINTVPCIYELIGTFFGCTQLDELSATGNNYIWSPGERTSLESLLWTFVSGSYGSAFAHSEGRREWEPALISECK